MFTGAFDQRLESTPLDPYQLFPRSREGSLAFCQNPVEVRSEPLPEALPARVGTRKLLGEDRKLVVEPAHRGTAAMRSRKASMRRAW